jgi:chromosome segregation ATPase
MARGGVYRTEVEKARNALLAQGKHPSVDAVRIALGNTGSKTTIHRYLKEIEAEEGEGVGAKVPLSEALTDLVGRLAAQLSEEADQRILEARTQCDAQLCEKAGELDQQRQTAAVLGEQLQHTETALQSERGDHDVTRAALTEATTTIRQLEERIGGLTARIGEHEAHAQSLEEKHRHARDALEHFRTSVKEQREQDQRRHEHQVQELQVALRQANETVTAKNHELLQLNRDNVRLTEKVSQLERDLTGAGADLRARDRELSELRPLTTAHEALQLRWADAHQTAEALRADATALRADLDEERRRRQEAEALAARSAGQIEALQDVLERLRAGSLPRSEQSAQGQPVGA